MVNIILVVLISLVSLGLGGAAATAENHETTEFSDARAVIDEAVSEFGARKVLVVFDIDNTVLATDRDFGSEHWFLWQKSLSERGDASRIADNVDNLLTVQSWIYAMTGTHLVEPRIRQDITELSRAGVRFLALTSRTVSVRDITIREFERNGIDLTARTIGPKGGYAETYFPYDLAVPEASGLSQDDITRFALPPPKSVIFNRGIMLTQGQHKGVMLRTLLKKTRTNVDAIIFIDDRSHHLSGVRDAFTGHREVIRTIFYRHELAKIEAFYAGDKMEVISQWCQLANVLSLINSDGIFNRCRP